MRSNALTPTILIRGFSLGLALVLIASAGCGTTGSEETTTETTVPLTTSLPSITDEPATTAAENGGADIGTLPPHEVIEVTFDGKGCTVSGPAEVPAGDRIFVFRDNSGVYTDFDVDAYRDGKSFQDAVDLQNEKGGPGTPLLTGGVPSWLRGATRSFAPVDIELADNESAHRYDLEPGGHGIRVWTDDPHHYWLCGPLVVVEP